MMLQEEGALLISDPVSRYLPAFANTAVAVPRAAGGYDLVEAEREITLRHLLTHTAGSGGAGLLFTARDYSRFLQMLLNEGELDGVRFLSPPSVQLMTAYHTDDLYEAEDVYWQPGTGFGLGFPVRLHGGAAGIPGSVGDYGWLGAYHSLYWVDPAEELVVVHLTQVSPASGLDDQQKLRALVCAAITESAQPR